VRSWPAGAHVLAAGPEYVLAAAGDDGIVRMWDVETGTVRGAFPCLAGQVEALAFDRTGTWLAVGDTYGAITLWEAGENAGGSLSTMRGRPTAR
jgi:WD40 repeat protein